MSDLSKRFLNGLKQYNINLETLKKKWKYCGGNTGRHYEYFLIACKDEILPDDANKCLCGHKIKENCFITDGYYIITLGNCCVKKFLKFNGRSCAICENPHRNRKTNKCNQCRYKMTKKYGRYVVKF
jgi:hypothetical protein